MIRLISIADKSYGDNTDDSPVEVIDNPHTKRSKQDLAAPVGMEEAPQGWGQSTVEHAQWATAAPVTDRGRSLLCKLGWTPGEAICKERVKAAEPLDIKPRAYRAGLGS